MASRRASIFINGKEVAREIKALTEQKRKLVRALREMEVGSKQYNATMKELDKINPILDKHRKRVRGIESVWKKAGSTITQFGAVAGVAFSVDMVVDFGKELFNLGAEMELLGAKAETVFGDQLGVVQEAAEGLANAMGLTRGQFVDLSAATGDLLVPMGFTRDLAAEMSVDITKLSGALSQWSGGKTSTTQASEILTKALLKQRDGLTGLGIQLSDADLKQRLVEKGMDKLKGNALKQAEAMATLEIVYEKTTDAQNAFGENTESTIAKQARLTAQMNEVKETLATELVPVFEYFIENALLPASRFVLEFVQALSSGENATGRFGSAINFLVPVVQDIGNVFNWVMTVLGSVFSFITGDFTKGFLQGEIALKNIGNTAINIFNRVAELTGSSKKIELFDTSTALADLEEIGRRLDQEAGKAPREIAAPKIGRTNSENMQSRDQQLQQQNAAAPTPTGRGSSRTASTNTANSNNKTDSSKAEKAAKEIEKRAEEINNFILKKNEELRLSLLTEEERRIEKVRIEYQTKLETVTAGSEQEKELTRLRNEEILVIETEFTEKRSQTAAEAELAKQAAIEAIQAEIDERLLSEEELAVQEVELRYEELTELALQHGLDITDIERARISELDGINAKFLNEKIAKEKAADKEILENKKALTEAENDLQSAKIEAYKSALDAIAGFAGENQKILDGIFVAQKAIAIAEIIINLQRQIASIAATNAALGPAGIPITVAQTTAAKIRAGIGIATIAATTIQRFTQRKEGGFAQVTGEDDRKTYQARRIENPEMGLLPPGPVLVNDRILANERTTTRGNAGREYYIPDWFIGRFPDVMQTVEYARVHKQLPGEKTTEKTQRIEGGYSFAPIHINRQLPRVFAAQQATQSVQLIRTQRMEGGFANNSNTDSSSREEFIAEETKLDAQLLAALQESTETNAQLAGAIVAMTKEMKKPKRAIITQREFVQGINEVSELNNSVGGGLLS